MQKNQKDNPNEEFDPNWTCEDGLSYLHYYAAEGIPIGIKVYSDAGCDVNKPDPSGCTPLHYAAFHGHLATVKALFNAGADPSVRSYYDETPADVAERGGHKHLARYIRKRSPW